MELSTLKAIYTVWKLHLYSNGDDDANADAEMPMPRFQMAFYSFISKVTGVLFYFKSC